MCYDCYQLWNVIQRFELLETRFQLSRGQKNQNQNPKKNKKKSKKSKIKKEKNKFERQKYKNIYISKFNYGNEYE